MVKLSLPAKTYLQYTNTCNLNCKLCYMDCKRSPDREELTLDQWKRLVDELVEDNLMQVYIEGGEPLARTDFLEFLAYTGTRLCTWFRTNATLIDVSMANSLKACNVGHVFVDVLGATAEIHDELVGQTGAFSKTMTGIRNLQDAGIETDIVTILNRKNAKEMQSYLELAAQMGIKRAGILRLYPIGSARRLWSELSLSLEQQMDVINGLDIPGGVHVMQSWHPHDDNCCGENAGINAWGDSIGCPYLREFVNYGNVLEQSFLSTWDHPLYKSLRETDIEDGCDECAKTEASRGGCRAAAYAFTGRWDTPDPLCIKTNGGIDVRIIPKWLSDKDSSIEDKTVA